MTIYSVFLGQFGGYVTHKHRISQSTPPHAAARGGHTPVVRRGHVIVAVGTTFYCICLSLPWYSHHICNYTHTHTHINTHTHTHTPTCIHAHIHTYTHTHIHTHTHTHTHQNPPEILLPHLPLPLALPYPAHLLY